MAFITFSYAPATDPVVSLVWATGATDETLREALADDPCVRDADRLATAGDGWLFGVEWTADALGFVDALLEAGGTVWEAVGAEGRWELQVLFPDRQALSETYHRFEERGVSFEVDTVHGLDAVYHSRYGLTEKERDALVTAFERGYYEVPHRVSTTELGAALGITHQAVSGRLRRGHGSLVGHALVVGHRGPPDGPDRPDEGGEEDREGDGEPSGR
mgnify:CR=1 FL=1